MSIIMCIGNIGSGKTASVVRDVVLNKHHMQTYSNIRMTNVMNNNPLKPDMLIEKDIVDHHKNKKTGDLEAVYKFKLNMAFWQKLDEPINVVIDEAHTLFNSRRSMSKVNIIMNDWLAMLRRVLGENSSGYGDLILITQLPYRIDVVCRDMANQIRYHICHYAKVCSKCSYSWTENTEMPEELKLCPKCDSHKLVKTNHVIEVYKFNGMNAYQNWLILRQKTYYRHYLIKDINKYFGNYNSFDIYDLFEGFY